MQPAPLFPAFPGYSCYICAGLLPQGLEAQAESLLLFSVAREGLSGDWGAARTIPLSAWCYSEVGQVLVSSLAFSPPLPTLPKK